MTEKSVLDVMEKRVPIFMTTKSKDLHDVITLVKPTQVLIYRNVSRRKPDDLKI